MLYVLDQYWLVRRRLSLAEMKNLELQYLWHMQPYKVLSIVYNRYILYVLDQYGLLKRRLSRHSLAEM